MILINTLTPNLTLLVVPLHTDPNFLSQGLFHTWLNDFDLVAQEGHSTRQLCIAFIQVVPQLFHYDVIFLLLL